MGRLTAVIFGVILGAVGVYSAQRYHFVRAKGEFLIVKKKVSTWGDFYADIRDWTPRDWNGHRELAQNMAAAGHGRYIVRPSNEGPFPNFMGSFRERPAMQPQSGHSP